MEDFTIWHITNQPSIITVYIEKYDKVDFETFLPVCDISVKLFKSNKNANFLFQM